MHLRHWLGAGLLFISGLAHAALTPQQEQLLQNAADAFAQGNYRPAAAALPQLANTYMGPWVAYWSLQPRLSTLQATQFQSFANEFPHGSAYLLLRRQWLLELGQRHDWQNFAEVYRAGPAPKNLSVRCYAAHNPLLQIGNPATLWDAATASNGACNRMARTALAQGQISQTLLWHKLAEMIRGGHLHSAGTFASFLPGTAASALNKLLQSPNTWLASQGSTALESYGAHDGAELLHLALLAMLPNDPALAVAQSQTLPGLSPAQRASVCYSAALQAAGKFQTSTANAWYQAALSVDPSFRPNAETLHWMVRSALLQQNWPLVLAAVGRLPADQAQQSQWQFWKALALQKTGKSALARQLWQQIASPFDAYGQLASAALGQSLRLPARSQSPAELVADAFSQPAAAGTTNNSLRRALKLYQLGLYFDALWEWGQYLDTLPDATAIKAADRQAAQNQAWLLVINASTRIGNDADWQQGYVLPYRQDIIASANRNGLSPSFVAGVIRQESGFAPGIRSSVGAQGIMQVMPATAAWVQSRYPQSAAADLQTAAGNIQIGTTYLAYLRSQFGDSPVLLAAAYNAGPGAVNRWLQKITLGESPWAGLIFAANIPYQQTRDYVTTVLSNAIVYRMLLSEAAASPLSYWQLAR
ncbi:lytic transglycosylase domain-containing protein [Acidithiobacillus sp. CV18-2]|uniref:Lytic transglycosylase domain-containing protein n=1 Tax=Igneacidithiobacillus copahuensis TaxID=2724909 RepID=A0AAE2YNU3_9PROT|nr:lytic transglycosylase domain-containing protein [Igneacidithiobacillus copahuensis]MBU2754435.1 lytic transglycosylase domain-containing protein [Acidithiobacillus sp. CV18-3]MBU2757542.1 lytic transglycosylase domain-containing protein [Acidithiobacillus sp. BN09-2]MBU2778270.1 lytic transglycosylase domain-containing protein [Acidithiobacillus sp. CV18-2]MBU2797456.1 lytic transglycosylase domain-containing protein [Acidithiobacillus sp. VAN18-2]MBU2799706.1 lytic transglycosylase domain